jgi:O-antigen ligase
MIKWLAAGIIVVSLLAGLASLPGAWTDYPGSVIPGVDERLRGIVPHANTLGPIPVIYLVIERWLPSGKYVRWPLMVGSLVTLALSQSKTAWGTALVLLALYVLAESGRTKRALMIATGCVASAVLLLFPGLALEGADTVLGEEQIDNAMTLTGRTAVWADGIEIWQEHPVLGAGPEAFKNYASATDQGWAGQAHNQAIQVLGTTGLVGLIGLVIYVVVMSRAAFLHRRRSRWASVSLLVLLLLRAVAETPIDELSLLHLGLYCLLLSLTHEAEIERDITASIGSSSQLHRAWGWPLDAAKGSRYSSEPQPTSPHNQQWAGRVSSIVDRTVNRAR